METERAHPRLAFRAGAWRRDSRTLPVEMPVALIYNGTTQAVMMATPADLPDFARGFSLTEGIISEISELSEIEIVEQDRGIELRMWLAKSAEARFRDRRRAQVGPVGCGLCGIDSLREALRALPPAVPEQFRMAPADIPAATEALVVAQRLNARTHAVHAAGFFRPGSGLGPVREDVGRHNALDKLAGALAAGGIDAGSGALVITSRVSVDMVQKAAMIGAPVLVAASAPTTLAVTEAEAAGLTLVAVARGAEFEVFTHPERLTGSETANVA